VLFSIKLNTIQYNIRLIQKIPAVTDANGLPAMNSNESSVKCLVLLH